MRWPGDHPAVTDPALAPWRAGADEVCPEAEVVAVLRHLPGRRVASLVRTAGGLRVLKVFASPRARGNDRRLRALALSRAGVLVPRPLGADSAGHVGLVSYAEGELFECLDDRRFVTTAEAVGAALRRLHGSGAQLDRRWGVAEEMEQLRRRATPTTRAAVERLPSAALPDDDAGGRSYVSAHRDCHPRQVVLTAAGVRWIDLDDAAMAPAGLDVGNFLAHLRRDAVLGRRCAAATTGAVAAFRRGYGPLPSQVDRWERLSLLRLAGLAELRHGSAEQAGTLLALSGFVLAGR